mgnify:CR=1 FL=1
MNPILHTKKEVANALRLSTRSLDNLIREKKIPSLKVGARRLFDLDDVGTALKKLYGESYGEPAS